jgi:hypothetical protein
LLAYRWSANQLIGPTELAIDMHPENERRTARYVEDIPAPSVIALSSIAAAEAVSHFMLAVTGLHHATALREEGPLFSKVWSARR